MSQKRLFAVSGICYFLSSASVLPMAWADISGKNGSAPLAFISATVFWLALLAAITVQLLLRRQRKPHRKKQPFKEMVFTLPTVFFEAGFLLTLLAVIILSLLNINGFVLFFLLFLMLFCFELSILTMGKFQNREGKTVFKM